MPQYTADHPISTALSPDGATLLVLTSGYNRVADIKAKKIPALSNEYVFVYDVRRNPPVKQQVIPVPNTYVGIAWAPDGHAFYVAGGMDDNVHVFYQNVESKIRQTSGLNHFRPSRSGTSSVLASDPEKKVKSTATSPWLRGWR